MSRNVLNLIRPLVAEIDGSGMITRTEGGNGGFLGHEPSALAGTSAFEHFEPDEATRLAEYFIEHAGGGMETVDLPHPFRVEMLDTDGQPQPVDIIPTAYEEDGVSAGWVIVAVPVLLTTAISAPLESEMAGAPRSEVRRLLAKELYGEQSRWMFIDLEPNNDSGLSAEITVAYPIDRPFADAVANAIADGWRPWENLCGAPADVVNGDELPTAVFDELRALGLDIAMVAPVEVDGRVVAAFMNVSSRGIGVDRLVITGNLMDRIASLVEVTALVLERWRDRDELNTLARTDALTGLANRQAFSEALDPDRAGSKVVYVDVDDFKLINDTFGHQTGDQVLQEVASRIVASCRPTDVVARLGGDEFAVLLDRVDMDTAELIGQRIVDSMHAPMPAPHSGRVTVSAGLARFDGKRRSVNAADQAMLTAKRSGRDQLVVA